MSGPQCRQRLPTRDNEQRAPATGHQREDLLGVTGVVHQQKAAPTVQQRAVERGPLGEFSGHALVRHV
ncbi:hypothetical protein JOD54_003612 [Actinokineospora baliensis]|nr:hypothetical protein [Actinokineospora baliensis]